MPFQRLPRLPRRPSVLASMLAAGLMLTAAGCTGHLTPLGPGGPPQLRQLRSPIVLQAMRVQPPTAAVAGGCPAGYAALAANPGGCYRKIGTPVTFGSAAVSQVASGQPKLASGQPAPAAYVIMITVPAAGVPALTAVTTTAYKAGGGVAISVAGRIWSVLMEGRPLTGRQFPVVLSGRTQALQLQRVLAGPG